jgi:hypothetical protein
MLWLKIATAEIVATALIVGAFALKHVPYLSLLGSIGGLLAFFLLSEYCRDQGWRRWQTICKVCAIALALVGILLLPFDTWFFAREMGHFIVSIFLRALALVCAVSGAFLAIMLIGQVHDELRALFHETDHTCYQK